MRIISILVTILIGVGTTAFAQEIQPYERGEILVQIPDIKRADRLFTDLKVVNGMETELRADYLVSAPMNIWLLRFNEDNINAHTLLAKVSNHPAVSIAQLNYLVTLRETVPNDPQLNQQWHHINTGAGGGTPDADIDSDLAWDITTGGLTALGDEIVVCVIEGGNLNHPDLAPNAWVNTQEIPGNGIDDDGNGYIDDYLGWNVASNNDNGVLSGGHGTQVMGMIGAKGDNNLGVVGANWNVKIMSVAGENISNQASVIAAYTYPLVMRQLYNSTGGAQGAFVVATNASWGIDNGNPATVPLWCAFYDTLGENGILNCGATANNNVNIDVVGDIPTACPSPYMVSVTATNNNDVRTFSAYGVINVDVGAPGSNVYTTSGTNGYGSTSGTSFASPLTAGVIALIYSSPCPAFMQLVHADPQLGADMVLQALYNGVDIVPNLVGQTVTGGRINAFNSVMEIMNNCPDGGCFTPFSLNVVQTPGTTDYTISWNGLDPLSYNLRYREVGTPDWTQVDDLTLTSFSLFALNFCSTYEFQVMANCEDDEFSDWTNNFTWNTDGCCTNPILSASQITGTGAIFSWNSILAAEYYTIRYRTIGSVEWIIIDNQFESPVVLTDLEECTQYEAQIRSNCADESPEFSVSINFGTSGCGACQDLNYCSSNGQSVADEWIQSVQFDAFTNVSGSNGGYADFTGNPYLMTIGVPQSFTLTPGFAGTAFTERWRIWIDYNQNGTFEAGELVYDSNTAVSTPVSGTFTIPNTALMGSTRMRISMKYIGGFGGAAPTACESFQYGEVEDYCIFIDEVSSVNNLEIGNVLMYPNPANSDMFIDLSKADVSLNNLSFEIIDMSGRLVSTAALRTTNERINVRNLAPGTYNLSLLQNGTRVATKQFVRTK
jgi:serine protease